MREQILEYLGKAGEPLPAARILLDILQIRSPSSSAADKILEGFLRKTASKLD
jgi:hypothetical protein